MNYEIFQFSHFLSSGNNSLFADCKSYHQVYSLELPAILIIQVICQAPEIEQAKTQHIVYLIVNFVIWDTRCTS